MTLTEFLLARIAEDEAEARGAGLDGGEWFSRHPDQPDCHMYGEYGWAVSGPNVEAEDSEWGKAVADHIARHDPARVLAECEAKRRIMELHKPMTLCANDVAAGYEPNCEGCWEEGGEDGAPTYPCRTLCYVGVIYADHPDYDELWRP